MLQRLFRRMQGSQDAQQARDTQGGAVPGAEDAATQRAASESTALQRRIEEHPERTELWSELAAAQLRGGRLDQALEAVEHALQLNPLRPADWAQKAEILLQLARPSEARKAVQAGLAAESRASESTTGASRAALEALQTRLNGDDGATAE